MPLFLFDIDGTLVRMGGAGSRAMNLTLEALHGVKDGFRGIDFRGGLDPLLVGEALGNAGIAPTPERIAAFRAAFVPTLAREVQVGARDVCPGVHRLLTTLQARGPLGLVTGNWEEGARVKLDVFGLWEPFFRGTPSAFGDDAPRRALLARVAVERAGAEGPVFLFGDTPADVESGKMAGAVTVAVATGWNRVDELEAAAPDLLLEDFERGWDPLMARIDG